MEDWAIGQVGTRISKESMLKIKTAALGLFAAVSGGGSAAVSWEARLEIWLRIVALIGGIIGAYGAFFWMNRINKVKEKREQGKLCEECIAGHPPRHCPIPKEDRPDECPFEQ